MYSINYLAVIVVAIINMILGGLWYGPFFGKEWSKMIGFTPEKMAAAKTKGMGTSYTLMFVGSLIMSYILAIFIGSAEAHYKIWSASYGIHIALLLWVGFVLPLTISSVLWESKPWKLWFINIGYYFVGLIIMGAILGSWI